MATASALGPVQGPIPAGSRGRESRDREAVSALEGPHRRLCLGWINAVDQPRVTPALLQMHARDLDVASDQERVHRGPAGRSAG
jgi:hypothetical protein